MPRPDCEGIFIGFELSVIVAKFISSLKSSVSGILNTRLKSCFIFIHVVAVAKISRPYSTE